MGPLSVLTVERSRWAVCLGSPAVHVLREYGPDSQESIYSVSCLRVNGQGASMFGRSRMGEGGGEGYLLSRGSMRVARFLCFHSLRHLHSHPCLAPTPPPQDSLFHPSDSMNLSIIESGGGGRAFAQNVLEWHVGIWCFSISFSILLMLAIPPSSPVGRAPGATYRTFGKFTENIFFLIPSLWFSFLGSVKSVTTGPSLYQLPKFCCYCPFPVFHIFEVYISF